MGRVEQVFKNTLHQAVRFAEKNSNIEIEKWVEHQQASRQLCFKVSFTGKIEAAQIEEEKKKSSPSGGDDYQQNNAVKNPFKKHNLDLMISKQICKKLKGNLGILENVSLTTSSSIQFSVECYEYEEIDQPLSSNSPGEKN